MLSLNAEELVDYKMTDYPNGDLKMNVHLARPIFNNTHMTHFIALTFFDPHVELTHEALAQLVSARYSFYRNLVERINNDLN